MNAELYYIRRQINDDANKRIEKQIKERQEDSDYKEYVKQNGHHFTLELAKFIVDKFVSINQKITFERINEMLKNSEDGLEDGDTLGDLFVMINEIRAAHSISTVKSDVHALSLALENLNNPNRDGDNLFDDWVDIFNRRQERIEWKKYINQ